MPLATSNDTPGRRCPQHVHALPHFARRVRRGSTAHLLVKPVVASFAQPFLCVSGMISCPTASCQGDRCRSFSRLPAIAQPTTALRQLGNGRRLIIVCFSVPIGF